MKPHPGHSVDGLREGCRGGIPVWGQGEEDNDPLPYISTIPYHRVICLVSLIIKQLPPSILAADATLFCGFHRHHPLFFIVMLISMERQGMAPLTDIMRQL